MKCWRGTCADDYPKGTAIPTFLSTLLAFVVVLGVLITVHELGHYSAARWCGVKVLRFAVGFGKVLWLRRAGPDQTEWVLSAFPLGGYVKMLDTREGEVNPAEAARAFDRQPVGKRMLIVAAGPLANFLLAFLLYWGLFWHGVEEPRALLGRPVAESPAAAAGFQAGDRVLRVGELEVESWPDFRWAVVESSAAASVGEVQVQAATGEVRTRSLAFDAIGDFSGDPFERLGLTFYRPEWPAVIGKVLPGSAAEQAGILNGDKVLEVAGAPVGHWSELVQTIRSHPGERLPLVLERGGQQLFLEVTVSDEAGVGRIGVALSEVGFDRGAYFVTKRFGPFAAALRAAQETWDKSWFSLRMMGRMLLGEVSLKNISGPVTIADHAGQSARLGMEYFLRFMALVSLSLGVLNLLPVPVLDGGHLMYHLIEIFTRSPVSERAVELGQRIGMALLSALIVLAFYNDIIRIISG